MHSYQYIDLRIERQIALLTMNRKEALHALSTAVLTELSHAIQAIEQNPNVRALIITGSGEKAFIVGGDIKEMSSKNALQALQYARLGNELCSQMENLPIPVIAAVNGVALGGGCELAMACDLRVASKRAKFGQPEIKLGIVPGFGGSQRLPRLVGVGKAMELLLTGETISAEEAYKIGLVNQVVEADDLLSACQALAERISAYSPIALAMNKRLVHEGINLDLDRALELERQAFGLMFSTYDQKEGMQAFLEKRKAVFQGN